MITPAIYQSPTRNGGLNQNN